MSHQCLAFLFVCFETESCYMYIAHAGLELNPPISVSQMLEL
jgi:hypothetical protein